MVRHTCHPVMLQHPCHPVMLRYTCHPIIVRHTCHPVMVQHTCHPERSEGSRCAQDDTQPQPAASPPSQRTPLWYSIPVILLWYAIPVILSAAKDLPAPSAILPTLSCGSPKQLSPALGCASHERQASPKPGRVPERPPSQ